MHRIAPFQFANLPKVSSQRAELSRAMSNCLPGFRWEDTFRELLGGAVRKYIRGKRQLQFNFQISNDEDPDQFWEKSFNPIEKESIVLGRNPASDIHLNSRVVSNQHARVVMDKGRCFIIDQSANGTFVNGKQISPKTPVPLANGDNISLYPFQISFAIGHSLTNEDTHIDFKVVNLAELSFAEVSRKLAVPIPIAIIGVEPSGRKALLELDPDFIIGMADLIFGGEGNLGSKLLRSLSNIETGVIEFLLLRVIKAVSDAASEFAAVTLRLEQLLVQGGQVLKNPEAIAEPHEPVLQTTIRVAIGELLGHLNLYLPYGLLKNAGDRQGRDSSKLELLRKWLPMMRTVKTELVAEIGSIRLSSSELSSLEASDIILLQDVGIKYYGRDLSGEISVRLGLWGETCFRGDIITEEGAMRVILNSVCRNPRAHKREEKMEENPRTTESIGELSDEDLAQSADFVQSVPVTVVVELGRRNLTISDVTRLRIGQIIDLQRLPTEPVDLSIDGKIIGKGELVDVDGELGVRILRLFN